MRTEGGERRGWMSARSWTSVRFIGLPLAVAVFTTLSLVFDGFDIASISFAAPQLLEEWGLDRKALAPVLAAGLLGMALGALVLGALGDYVGRRRALIVSMSLVALGSWLSVYATGTATCPGTGLSRASGWVARCRMRLH